MFGRKTCPNCGKRTSKDANFCPYCGSQLKEFYKKREPDNLFDALDDELPFFRFPFRRLVESIEKQVREMDKMFEEKRKETPEVGISISISASDRGEPIIRVRRFGKPEIAQPKVEEVETEPKQQVEPKQLSKELKRFAELPKQEPQTKVRRLSDKIVYEIELPGVKNEKNITITRLQNSIEIKAVTKDKAYFKLIPISLPIKNHRLEKDKLILELKPQA